MTINKNIELPNKPDRKFEVSETFGIDSKLSVKGFKEKTAWVPEIDEGYIFDKDSGANDKFQSGFKKVIDKPLRMCYK